MLSEVTMAKTGLSRSSKYILRIDMWLVTLMMSCSSIAEIFCGRDVDG